MKTDDVKSVLASLPLFRQLGPDALDRVSRATVVKDLAEDGLLFLEGEPCRGLFVILEGSVKIYRSNEEGREQVLHVEHAVHTLAELPLFDGSPYPASARAAEPTRVLFLPRDSFRALYHENPEIADAVIRDLGRRLRKLVGLVEKVTLRDVPARVAATLLEAASAAGVAEDGGELELPVTQADLADELATTRESVARALARLRNDGVIDQDGARVRIRDLARLEEAAGVSVEALGLSVFDRAMPIPGR